MGGMSKTQMTKIGWRASEFKLTDMKRENKDCNTHSHKEQGEETSRGRDVAEINPYPGIPDMSGCCLYMVYRHISPSFDLAVTWGP